MIKKRIEALIDVGACSVFNTLLLAFLIFDCLESDQREYLERLVDLKSYAYLVRPRPFVKTFELYSFIYIFFNFF